MTERHLHAVGAVEAEHAEWLEWRRNGLGASDIAGVLGLSPWESPWSIWARKVGLTSEPDSSEAMEFGKRAEPMLAEYFAERTGLWIHGEQTRCANLEHPWMQATVDGFADEAHAGTDDLTEMLGPVEFKVTADSASEWAEQIPMHYACQATWTAIVTGFPKVFFGVLHLSFGRPQFRTYEFTPGLDDIALVTVRAREFWLANVVPGIPPDVDASEATTRALREAYPGNPDLDNVEADAELLRALERIRANEQRVKDCSKIVDEAKNLIRATLCDQTVLTHGTDDKGRPRILATWKPGTRSGIDLAALRADQPELAAKYSKITPTRTLLIKPLKENR